MKHLWRRPFPTTASVTGAAWTQRLQVCAPYAGSAEEAELKLSYDPFYLGHFSIVLDLLILIKTTKMVLKAQGR